jgi:hypothetical protein
MSVALMAPVTYPFEFFCEERYTVTEVLELAMGGYRECDGTGKLPPSFHGILSNASSIYPSELFHRALLRDDVEHYGHSIRDEIVSGLESGAYEDVEEMVQDAIDGGQTFDLDAGFGEEFMNDIEYALKAANLCYAQINDDEDGDTWDNYKSGKCPSKNFKIFNCPIVGVW